jgi:uncharacterized protein (TIGR02611 family)
MRVGRKITQAFGLRHSPRLRKVVIGVIGGTVLLIGIALLLLPGPAAIVIPIGLIILATEFAWARRVLRSGKNAADRVRRGRWRDFFSFTRQA